LSYQKKNPFLVQASHLDIGFELADQVMDYPFLWVFWPFPLNVQVELARFPLCDELVEVPIFCLVQSVPQEILTSRVGCIHLDTRFLFQIIEGHHEIMTMRFRIVEHLFLRSFAIHLLLEPFRSRWVREDFAWLLRGRVRILQTTCLWVVG
jgi:hypothetical protein